jgi:asparagine synthase (glutamine-hydrolysing)
MSGIAAIFELDGAPARGELIDAMMARLAHRGPDGAACEVSGSIALGHCLLATTPEDTLARQPLTRDRRWIVADARLDNRQEILDALAVVGRDRALSDAELILRAYEAWGAACPRRLLGDFAFVIWDGARRELFCARDPMGVKQLFYVHDAGTFRCASEMHALFADPRVRRRPHRRSLALFLTYQYTEREQTLWEGVIALTPAHTVTVGAATLRRAAYWRPDLDPRRRQATPDERAEEFRSVFTEAVRCRLRSARPVAAEVSGGLDSSSIASVAEELRQQGRVSGPPITMLHLAFPGLSCDEGPYSQAVADRWGMALTTAYPTEMPALLSPDPVRCARDVYFHPTMAMLEPLIKTGLERGIRTTLTGLGSDQLMHRTGVECAGKLRRGHPVEAARAVGLDRASFSARSLRSAVRQGLVPLLPYGLQRTLLRKFRRLPPAWRWLRPPWQEEMRREMEVLEQKTYDLGPEPETRETAARILWGYDTSQVLGQCDRHTAGFGAEQRHPFFDQRVVELLLGLPPEERYDNGVLKPILRRAMNGTLPSLVRDRPDKAILTDYVRERFYKPYWGRFCELARQSRLAEEGIIEGDAIRGFLEGGPGASRVPLELLSFVALELWYRQPLK